MTWTKPLPPSHHKINLRRLQPSDKTIGTIEAGVAVEVMVEEISPDPTEAGPTEAAAAEVVRIKVRVKVRVVAEAPDTLQTHQSPAVNAITSTETKLGTVWLPSPVPGSISVLQEPEGQTSLARRIKIMT